MITRNQLLRYLALQYIGYVNMNDLLKVYKLTGLSSDDIRYIQANYVALLEKELPKNEGMIIKDIISAIPIDNYIIEL